MKKIAFTTLVLALVCCMFIFCACSDNTEEIRNGEFKSIALATVGVEDGEIEYSNVVEETSGDFVVEIVIQGIRYDVTIGADKTVKSIKINDRSVQKEHLPCSPFSPNCGYIGKQAAKEAAFSDAGVTVDDVTNIRVEFDFDDGKYLYEVEFRVGTVKYEYDIDATTGEIYKKDVDEKTCVVTQPEGVEFITADEAIAIAIANAGLDAEGVTVTKATLDFEKGAYVYEVEFEIDEVEYEYEVNAITGAIIKTECEGGYRHQNGGGSQGGNGFHGGRYIGAEEAKRIATAHAGVTDAVFEKAELSMGHGVVVYEVEFEADGYEYEYVIDANDGRIIKQDKELAD